MQSHYEINVALKGKHLFATAERSAVRREEHDVLLKLFRQKFPKSEGYNVTSTYIEVIGHGIE